MVVHLPNSFKLAKRTETFFIREQLTMGFQKLPEEIADLITELIDVLACEELVGFSNDLQIKTIGGNRHLVAGTEAGQASVSGYVGHETPVLLRRLERLRSGEISAAALEARREEILAQLKRVSFLPVEQETGALLATLAKHGVFRMGGVLVGTHAFRLYEVLLGIRFDSGYADFTRDVDIAAFQRLSGEISELGQVSVPAILEQLGYAPAMGLEPERCWRWVMSSDREHSVEFLAPSFDASEGLVKLPAFSVDAQSLHFLNFLLADTVQVCVLQDSGFLVRIPAPERFALHKLIVATRRHPNAAEKAAKDRRQAKLLIEVCMKTRKPELKLAWEDAMERGAAWRKRLKDAVCRDADLVSLMSEEFLS
ncbi:GSU2403 family nucleotidyltransferase fold protein [Thalassospira sp. MCCC 1A02491]|uniref:GSU2403 family nucleotidyltransferase fold protein n=1 Tax=Thalassospira sp. MCCC 1A02491 TaxID=1769751 RepID=UPI0007AD75AF|nr:GSU2403 family nucleotidyltransferase fold protein [Thalassospira sp. MCCC 1A02491]KZB67200.1 hypothetical protein AUQ42_12990 [Thalassospira sp. MCCC 1A02491]